jgi:hypothetical protein
MTSGDNNQMDAQLEALLQAMPQPRPSAELDAAILADAEAALAKNPVAQRDAANDAVTPESANARRPSFLTRWKVPLAFAATVMLAVHIVGLQWFAAPVYDAPEVSAAVPAAPAAAPAASAADAAPSSTAAELRRAAPAAKPMEQARAKQAQPAAAEARKEKRVLSAAPQAAAGLAEKKSSDSAGSPAGLAHKSETAALKAEAAPAPPMAAVAPVPAPAPAAPAPLAMAKPAAPAATVGEVQPDLSKQLAPAQTARPAMRAEGPATGTVSSGIRGLSSEASRAREAPQAAAAAIPEAKTAAPASNQTPVAADASIAGTPAGGAADGVSSAARYGMADRAFKSPRDWLALIDKLIADRKPKEALEEWTRFRKQYPDHQVTPELQKRIDALKQ